MGSFGFSDLGSLDSVDSSDVQLSDVTGTPYNSLSGSSSGFYIGDASPYETPVTLDSSFGLTTTTNPSLGASPSTLSATGGAALNTVSANPTLYSTGTGGTAAQIGALSTAIGQWGFSLANLLGGSSPTQSQQGQAAGIKVVQASGGSSNTMFLLFGVAVVIAVLLVIHEE